MCIFIKNSCIRRTVVPHRRFFVVLHFKRDLSDNHGQRIFIPPHNLPPETTSLLHRSRYLAHHNEKEWVSILAVANYDCYNGMRVLFSLEWVYSLFSDSFRLSIVKIVLIHLQGFSWTTTVVWLAGWHVLIDYTSFSYTKSNKSLCKYAHCD